MGDMEKNLYERGEVPFSADLLEGMVRDAVKGATAPSAEAFVAEWASDGVPSDAFVETLVAAAQRGAAVVNFPMKTVELSGTSENEEVSPGLVQWSLRANSSLSPFCAWLNQCRIPFRVKISLAPSGPNFAFNPVLKVWLVRESVDEEAS